MNITVCIDMEGGNADTVPAFSPLFTVNGALN